MADRPDFTYLAETDIIAQTIGNVAIDIAAQTIAELAIKTTGATKLAIDIAAQTIAELAIKTSGVTKLAVDIAAQTLTALGINITAQDLAELVIKINAQAVGIYLQPEWAAKEGTDKSISVLDGEMEDRAAASASYVVTDGKTLYLTDFTGGAWNFDEFGAGKQQLALFLLFDDTDGTTYAHPGGIGGIAVVFAKPKVVPAGHSLRVQVENYSGHVSGMHAVVNGYEI